MAEKDFKNLIVTTKSFARANPLPLDAYEVWDSFEEAEAYAKSPLAYPGQTLKVKTDSGKYQTFIIQTNEDKELVIEKLPSGGAPSPEEIAMILNEAKAYTDTSLTIYEF